MTHVIGLEGVATPTGDATDSKPTERRPLGELLVVRGLVTGEELLEALAEQQDSGLRLGEILLSRGCVSRPALADALVAQEHGAVPREGGFGAGLRDAIDEFHRQQRSGTSAAPAEPSAPLARGSEEMSPPNPSGGQSDGARDRRLLGELLVVAGLLREEELLDALADQEQSGSQLGAILLERGLVSVPVLRHALAEQQQGAVETEVGFGSGLRDALLGTYLRSRGPSAPGDPVEESAEAHSAAADIGAVVDDLAAEPCEAHAEHEAVEEVEEEAPERPPIGHLLVMSGFLTEEELGDALAEQDGSGRRLGEILLARGLVCRAALGNALAEQEQGEVTMEVGFGSGLRDALLLKHRRAA